ncbi:unnamed protein product [Adineta ricciae]|uniref:Uncharacterized protein n=1 Tax=Adineta ricciae TaxID=249248 RepID=A0A814JGT0_ADIRI|nr:unnamed protein product [Adineta ricciae]
MGKTNKLFVDVDMALARTELLNTFDVYLRNDFSKLNLTNNTTSNDPNKSDSGLFQKIEESVKQLRNAEVHLTGATVNDGVPDNLCTSTEQLMMDIQTLHVQNYVLDETPSEKTRLVFCVLPKQEKSQLKQ